MIKLRHAYAALVLLFWLFLPAGAASAQVPPPVSYLFVEVKDTSWKPVGDDGKEDHGEKTDTDKVGILLNAGRFSYRFNQGPALPLSTTGYEALPGRRLRRADDRVQASAKRDQILYPPQLAVTKLDFLLTLSR